jgi:lipoate-protein ligase B
VEVKIFDLGLIGFQKAWIFQRQVFKAVRASCLDSAIISCQHDPVITLGRQGHQNNILASKELLCQRKIQLQAIERGGDVTYHGPGQVTIYPVCNLNLFKKDIHWFLRHLEGTVIDFLGNFGIIGERKPGFTGVWIGNQKIASIGIAIRHWITFHGISVNIKHNDLPNFSLIRPCGMDIKMTSLETLLGRETCIQDVKLTLANQFRDKLLAEAESVPVWSSFA